MKNQKCVKKSILEKVWISGFFQQIWILGPLKRIFDKSGKDWAWNRKDIKILSFDNFCPFLTGFNPSLICKFSFWFFLCSSSPKGYGLYFGTWLAQLTIQNKCYPYEPQRCVKKMWNRLVSVLFISRNESWKNWPWHSKRWTFTMSRCTHDESIVSCVKVVKQVIFTPAWTKLVSLPNLQLDPIVSHWC